MNALELADKLQSHASSQYGELCGSLWDAGAMLRNLHTENMALRCTEMALRDEIESLRRQLAARVPDGVFAWATFDGEGGYELRLYDGNESYRDDFIKRNGPKYASWVFPLYTDPQQASKPMTEREIWESDAIMEVNADAQIAFENIVRFVRAVERFHKIGGNDA